MKFSLKQRIEAYMKARHTIWIPKGTICDVARASELHATGEHCGRRLREAVEDGTLEVRYDKKGHAEYRFKSRSIMSRPPLGFSDVPENEKTLFRSRPIA